jgi:phosphoserine phosphatase RsbU/P
VPDLAALSTRWELAPGSEIVRYTDGLIERRKVSIAEGIERLRSEVRSGEPDRLCGRLMDALIESHVPTGDVGLLASG